MSPDTDFNCPSGARRAGLSLLVLALLGALLLACAGNAGATIFRPPSAIQDEERFVLKKGVFLVSVEGVQTNVWQEDKDPLFECDVASKGSGSERVRFTAPARRMRISAFGQKRADSAIFAPLPVRATVTRKGKREQTPASAIPEHCLADGGDGVVQAPPKPDCGTKRSSGLKLSLVALDGELTLDRTSTETTPPDPFKNCTWSGRVWPSLLTTTGGGKQISTEFSPKWVFNPKFNRRTGAWSKLIMIARGSRSGGSFGTRYTTKIRWTVTLKRLR